VTAIVQPRRRHVWEASIFDHKIADVMDFRPVMPGDGMDGEGKKAKM